VTDPPGGGLRSPFFRRLFLVTAAVAFLPLVATAIASLVLARQAALDGTATRLRSEALLVREACREPARTRDRAALDALVKRLGRELETRFTVIDGAGVVWGDSDHDPATMENHGTRPEVIAARETGFGRAVRWSDTLKEEMVYVAVLLDETHADGGIVRAALPEQVLAARFRSSLLAVASIAGPLGLLASTVLAFALHGVASALGEVSRAAHAVAQGGGLEPMNAVERRDEIGAVARSVRHMAAELGRRIETSERERNELKTIVSGVAEGLVALDARGRLLFSNEAAARLLAMPEPRAGIELAQAIPHGGIVSAARDALTKGIVVTCTVEVFRSESPAREVEVRATPIEKGTGVVLVLRDVTEAARFERLRREFVANASHELRTPLSLVKGCLETLEDGALADPTKAPRFVQIASRHVDSLAALVEDLLTLGRLDAAVDTRPPEPVDFVAVVEGVLAGFGEAVERKKLALGRNIPPDLPRALGHRDLLERAIRNLVDNAVKYTDEGFVRVSVETEGNELVVEVADSGTGIPRGDLGRIFERFYRVEKSRSREAGGTGLGLAIVKHIAQQEGGSVSVESELGKGSRFRFAVPAAPPPSDIGPQPGER
jgi:two-component system phosphate regulon sensor histidine kinase PhoR